EEHEADQIELSRVRGEEFPDRLERDRRRLADRKPVRAGRDRRERERADAVGDRHLETPPIGAREQLGLATRTAPVDRSDGVDHEARPETTAARDLRIAGRAAAEAAALVQDRGPTRAVDRAVDAAAAEERRVRGVHDRVRVLLRDVAANELEP